MGMVAFRIPNEMKEQMDRADINWSDYIRRAINEALQSKQKRELIRKIHAVTGVKKAKAGSSVKILRKLREHA